MSAKDRDVDLVTGDLLKPLVVLSLPIVLSQLMQVAYNLADTFWVGRLGQDPVSALSLAWPIVFLTISLAGGLSVAGTVLVSQNKGAGNLDRVNHVAGQTIGFVVLVSLGLSAVGWLLTPTLISLIAGRTNPVVQALAVEYTRTIIAGIFFIPCAEAVIAIGAEYLYIVAPTFFALGAFRVIMGGFQGSGNTRTAMAFSMLSLWVFRVPPAYALLAWFDMGATGVWVATAFSNVVTVVLAYLWFRRGRWRDSVVDADRHPRAAAADD